MSTQRITALLEKRLGEWAAIKGIPLAAENVSFDDTGTMYLQSHVMPATTDAIDLAQVSRVFRGVYQININVKAGGGKSKSHIIAAELIELFNLNTELTDGVVTCYINSVPSQFPSITNGISYTTPISMSYRADVI
ncbi:hypothetical protein CQP30_16995 [Yersinia pestis]|uniref:Phage protein n=7 Tax=Yersinia pestis TaxID=632 RepID=A0AAX2I5S7_YERPE|nr:MULTISPECIES: DUF4128 domain-containing protein [Yersinia pseudotuberculosis complex]EDR31309.1 conserved hypothetical protein [Yersinia pestis biovar Orientalis str. IP275]EFA50062.1 conserved hypothetical protein [Yersinia pestis KIM D27]ERP73091.1 hypothetical protein L327_10565 [Yersinia pestis S3]ERP73714.1 hypothetical protein L328_10605 [Yersinia pestis 24H]AAM85761.1 hypothetical [Yersinia pestis KIM10+]